MLAVALILSANVFVVLASSSSLRGVAPELVSRYKSGDKFTCFDGSLTIAASRVNDNYCDCPDSSDEPGTSACPNGVFYCANAGFKPKRLGTQATSRMNIENDVVFLDCVSVFDRFVL
jgi:protein kinase C substrate 80K-H